MLDGSRMSIANSAFAASADSSAQTLNLTGPAYTNALTGLLVQHSCALPFLKNRVVGPTAVAVASEFTWEEPAAASSARVPEPNEIIDGAASVKSAFVAMTHLL